MLFARIFLNQDVAVSSPQPQPIDDLAGMQAVPWDGSPPRAVQVVSRHGAIGLMPLIFQKRQERRCSPPFSPRPHSKVYLASGIAPAAESRRMHARGLLAVKGYLFSHRQIAPHIELGLSPEPPISQVVLCFERSEPLRVGQLTDAGSPRKLCSNRTHLG